MNKPMKKRVVIAAGLVFASTALHAQTEKHATTAFQYFVEGPGPGVAGIKMLSMEGMTGQLVTGKPLSATEERDTLQVLGDGTRIKNTQTNKFYRDSEGRTRVERPNGSIVLQDPVAGFIAELDSESKSVRRKVILKTNVDRHGNSAFSATSEAVAKEKVRAEIAVREGMAGGMAVSTTGPNFTNVFAYSVGRNEKAASEANTNKENLGIQSVNGVTAQGSRTTMTIPVGQIGNDRPIQVISEQWFSTDLQMLVKSTNSDPRFGETSYQLTNINQAAPDPSLFTIPADYTSRQ